jgi:hypothetical protein
MIFSENRYPVFRIRLNQEGLPMAGWHETGFDAIRDLRKAGVSPSRSDRWLVNDETVPEQQGDMIA